MIALSLAAGIILGTCCTPARSDLLDFASGKGEECFQRVNGTTGVIAECIEAPDQKTVQCPVKDADATTKHVGIPVSIAFNNTAGDEVSLYWVSDAGEEILQKIILPWHSTTQDTFMGHVFRMRSKTGRTLLEHTVGLIPLRDVIPLSDAANDADSISKPRPKVQPDTDAPVEVSFVNRADSVLKLYFYNAGSLQFVANLEPHTAYPQQTYRGHEFRVYSSSDRFVQSVQIGDIVVPSCMEPMRLDPVVHDLLDKSRNELNDMECVSCSVKTTRTGKLKTRSHQDNAKENLQARNVLKIRRLSSRDEL